MSNEKHMACESAGERGFHTSCQRFSLNFILYDRLSPRLSKCHDSCFLGVCVCFVESLFSGIPRLWFSLEVERRERPSSLDLAEAAFLLSVKKTPSTSSARGAPARGSCLSSRGISQLHGSRALCHTETLQNNARKDLFFRLCRTTHYCGVS